MSLKNQFPGLLCGALCSAVLGLTLSGCGGGGGSSAPVSPGTAAPVTTQVQGDVVKGIIRDGVVTAYQLDNGIPSQTIASTRTDALGRFSFQFTEYDGPVYIEVSSHPDGTWMTCDSADGCGPFSGISDLDSNQNGIIDFGEEFKVPGDFLLTAAISSDHLGSPFSVTTLTHLATQLAQTYPQGVNDISIVVAASLLEDLFSVQGIGRSQVINLANPESVNRASELQLQYSLIASALMGLSNDQGFMAVLHALSSQLQSQQGQLISHGADDGAVTLLDLTEQALKTAQHLNLSTVGDLFRNRKNAILAQAAGSLTEAKASPTAAGETAQIIDAFMQDLTSWQGYLSLSPDQPSFANVVSSIGVSTGSDLTRMLQAIAIAGQYGPVVALPDLALGAACDTLGNALAKITCRMLIANRSLEEICEGSLNLVIFNRSLCDILNDLTLPLGNGLKGNFALYDGHARIYGTRNEVEVDITFTAQSRSGTRYGFSVTGYAATETGEMNITDGRFDFTFEDAVDIRNLKLPENASGAIQVNYQQFTNEVNGESTSFAGNLVVDLDLAGVRLEGDGEEPTLEGLENIALSLQAEGAFESQYGDHFDGSLSLNGGPDSHINVQFETDLPDYSDRATITLNSSPAQLAEGRIEDLSMSWGGKHYTTLYFFQPAWGTRIRNQDGVQLDLDLSVDDGETAGWLYHKGTRYGRVSPLNGSLLFELSDGREVVL